MRDKSLETQLRLLTLQLDNWKKLHDLITYGLDKARPIISAEQERQFTEIRANLLQETEHVFGVLGVLGELSGRAMNVLQRSVSVRGVRELSNEEIRRLETEWNGVFEVVQRTLDHITSSLANNVAVELRNFGVFQPRLTKPRVGRNPNEPGSSFVIPPRATVKFKAGKIMRQRVEKLSRELKEASERKAADQQQSAATVPAS